MITVPGIPEEYETLKDFCQQCPKLELHAHLNGCISEKTLFELAAERGVNVSSYHFAPPPPCNNGESLLYNVKPRSLTDCFAMFGEIATIVNDLEALRRVTREALEAFARERVAYLELRSTPKTLRRNWKDSMLATKRDYLETVMMELQAFTAEEEARYQTHCSNADQSSPARLPLLSKLIVSIDRAGTVDDAMEHARLAVELAREERYQSTLVAVDLGGNPLKNEFQDFEAAFHLARDTAGLRTTIHVGEIQCKEAGSFKTRAYRDAEAVIDFQPDRLGHALLLPPSLNAQLDQLKIPIECCPTSNVMTLELAKHFHGNLVEGLRRHPQQNKWIKAGYPISVCTDDPGVFGTTVSQELLLTALAFGLRRDDIRSIITQSIEHAFCTTEEKVRLQQSFLQNFNLLLPRTR